MLIYLYTFFTSEDKETIIFMKITSHLEMNKIESENSPQFAVEVVGDGIRERVWLSMILVISIGHTF